MSRIIFQMMVSLDGYFEDADKALDWHRVDDEFNAYAIDLLNEVEGLIFGRVTYEMMAAYWPGANAIQDDPVIAGKMNQLPKMVFSNTLKTAGWNNTTIYNASMIDHLRQLKQQPGPDWAIFGSSDLALSLIRPGLIDEYRIMINPVVLGNGKALFRGMNERLQLKLVNSRVFNSGVVLLFYVPNEVNSGST